MQQHWSISYQDSAQTLHRGRHNQRAALQRPRNKRVVTEKRRQLCSDTLKRSRNVKTLTWNQEVFSLLMNKQPMNVTGHFMAGFQTWQHHTSVYRFKVYLNKQNGQKYAIFTNTILWQTKNVTLIRKPRLTQTWAADTWQTFSDVWVNLQVNVHVTKLFVEAVKMRVDTLCIVIPLNYIFVQTQLKEIHIYYFNFVKVLSS